MRMGAVLLYHDPKISGDDIRMTFHVAIRAAVSIKEKAFSSPKWLFPWPLLITASLILPPSPLSPSHSVWLSIWMRLWATFSSAHSRESELNDL